MEIILGKNAGFCFGVKNAIKREYEVLPSRFAAQLFQISEPYEYLSVSPNGNKPGKR